MKENILISSHRLVERKPETEAGHLFALLLENLFIRLVQTFVKDRALHFREFSVWVLLKRISFFLTEVIFFPPQYTLSHPYNFCVKFIAMLL